MSARAVIGAAAERGRERYANWLTTDDLLVDEGGVGRGFVVAPAPDWPVGWWLLQCPLDRSTWVGPEGERCWQCEKRIERIRAEQAQLDASRKREAA